jgi:hypothetical protein
VIDTYSTKIEFPNQISVTYDPNNVNNMLDILHMVSSPFTLEHALNQHKTHPDATASSSGDWALGDAQNFEIFIG